MKIHLTFSECEHQGDLDTYASDVCKAGGKIVSMRVDNDDDCCAETGHIVAEVENKEKFWTLFKQTDSFDFCG
jgi:hypothetical protein